MTSTFVLTSERERWFALEAVRKARVGDKPDQVRISKPTRNERDNAHLHAVLTDISKQLIWPQPPLADGELRSVLWWKRSLTLTWLRELKEMPEVIADIHGETFGIIIPHTSDLLTDQCSALIMWCTAFGATNGVVFKEKKQPVPPPEAYEGDGR